MFHIPSSICHLSLWFHAIERAESELFAHLFAHLLEDQFRAPSLHVRYVSLDHQPGRVKRLPLGYFVVIWCTGKQTVFQQRTSSGFSFLAPLGKTLPSNSTETRQDGNTMHRQWGGTEGASMETRSSILHLPWDVLAPRTRSHRTEVFCWCLFALSSWIEACSAFWYGYTF